MNEAQFLATLGNRIRDLRNSKKISQQDLAALCEFEKASMSRIESGRTNMTVLTLLKISKELGVPMAEFFRE
jgi:transcriptional regulator with XRE-family HTH domain